METKDILLFESGDGGEMLISSNDLCLTETILQQAYLAMFGGNLEANTTGNELESQERADYWANALLWSDFPSKQFNSNTERTLQTVALNSSGRLEIISAVESDLEYLNLVVNFSVEVSILSTSKVEIKILLSRKQNLEDKILVLVFDNAKNEIITQKII